MRSIFCGNFEYDAQESELERLFRRYGRVERIDMKSGFAFIFMEDERDGEDAIRALDMKEFGRKGRRLRVEWTKQQDRGIRKPMGSKRSANTRPSKTLFVINFDPYNTRTRDLERHFDPYGKIENVRIRKNFAFIQFELQEDATRALEATNMSKLMDHVISVEYSVRDDDKKNGYSPRDGPYEGGRDRGRSPSPYRRERASPDYGRRDPSPYRRERPSPDYGRRRSPSPVRKDRANPDYGRANVRVRSRSPYRRDKASPDNVRIRSRSPYRRDKVSPGGIRTRSPYQKERVRAGSDQGRALSHSPYGKDIVSPDNQRERSGSLEEGERVNGRDPSTSPYGRKRTSPDHDNGRNSSTYQKEKDNTNDDHPNGSPNVRSAQGDSPFSDGDNSPAHKRYHSRSPPPMREGSPSD